MVNKKLVEYIRDVKTKGYKDEAIITHLKKHGYPEHIIDDAFESLNSKFNKIYIAMVVLISIAVLLIIGIIFIGLKDRIRIFQPNPVCSDVEISLYEYRDKSIFCNIVGNEMKIQVPVENSGQIDISEMRIQIKGKEKKSNDIDEKIVIKSGDIFPKLISYSPDENGELDSISFIPIVYRDNKKITCKNKALIIEEFNCG
ncbi:hypothetical protein JXB41_05375 [Candidatus Woesearchaeota archaeon]|nr:hypothetical protein [Candidatus Woesearchaeota archaeon]